MTDHADPERRLEVRAQAGRFLLMLGATGVAIAYPLLEAFGRSPETFVFRRADRAALVGFALLVVLVPATALWAVGFVIGFGRPQRRRVVDGIGVGVLFALLIASLAASWPAILALAATVVAGLLVGVLVVRASAVRLWLQLLAALPAIAMVVFLVASDASDAVQGGGLEPIAGAERVGAPVVLIVLDELPTASLLGADGGIDPVRFPHLARFAADATWYRNATATSGWTATAVPAILSGQLPTNESSVFTARPDSIFRLLAGTHDLVVSEPTTRLCPLELCGAAPIPPVRAATPAPSGPELGGLLGDAVELVGQRVRGVDPDEQLAQFEEAVTAAASGVSGVSPLSGTAELPGRSQGSLTVQPTRVREFVDALTLGDRPLAAIMHTVLPHHPWRLLPDGRSYADPADESWLQEWSSNEWIAHVERQQHLLQVMFADRVVGEVLDRVRELGVYDEAVVVVTADHGVGFPSEGGFARLYAAQLADDIMWVPLLVKAPGQQTAAVDDANVENVDILPTIASLAGIDVPWAVDGAAVGSPAIVARGDTKRFFRLKSILEDESQEEVYQVDGRAGLRAVLANRFPAITAREDAVRGLYRLAPRGDLVGTPFVTSGSVTAGALEVDDRDRLVEGSEPVVVVSGRVDGRRADHVVAAVGGTIVAVSPVYEIGDARRFLLLLPASAPVDPRAVEFGIVEGRGASAPIRAAGGLDG